MRSPRCMEVRIASKTASTATSALTFVMSAIFDTSFTMSTLIMLRVSWRLVTTIGTATYAVNVEAKLLSERRECCDRASIGPEARRNTDQRYEETAEPA